MVDRLIQASDITGLPAILSRSLNAREYLASGSDLATTGTIADDDDVLTLASALDFENGHGIAVFGAGALATVQPPTGITPINVGTTGAASNTYRVASIDEFGGVGVAAAGVTINTANASPSMNNYVGISWTAPAAGPVPKAYAVYKNNAFVGIAGNATSFNDQGTVRARPAWCPATPPAAATAGALVTSIVSGAGTTSIVLADPSATAVTGAVVNHDDTVALVDAFTAAMGTKRLAINGGIYRISSSILLTATGSLDIVCPRNAILKSSSFLADQIFGMSDNVGRNRYSLSWCGGQFNNSEGLSGIAVASNSCIGTTRIGELIVERVLFQGAATLEAASVSTDSGIAFVDASNVSITKNIFNGQGDLGVYGSGGGLSSAEDDGGNVIIGGNHFNYCGTAIGIKRQLPRSIISNNTIDGCFAGVAALEASLAPAIDPGRQLLIANNTIRKTVCAPICVHGGPVAAKAHMANNKIVDFGYLPDGVTPYNGSAAYGGTIAGIVIQGASQCRISGGEISLDEWANGDDGTANHKGIYATDFVLNSVTYNIDALLIDNVDFTNVNKGIFEQTGTANGPTIARGCTYRNVGTKTTFVHASSMNEELDAVNGWIRGTVGSTELWRFSNAGIFATRFRTFLDSVGITKINRTSAVLDFGPIPAHSTSDLTVTVTGATVASGKVTVTPQASNLMPSGIHYFAWISAANTVSIRAVNNTGAEIDIPSGTYIVYVLQIS